MSPKQQALFETRGLYPNLFLLFDDHSQQPHIPGSAQLNERVR